MDDLFVIGLDVDGVICDMVNATLDINNKNFEAKIPGYIGRFYEHNIVDYKLENTIGNQAWNDIVNIPNFVMNLPLYTNSLMLVDELKKLGRVVFVTAPYWKCKSWVYERYCWIKKYFNTDDQDILFATNKTHFSGSMLIDDSSRNLSEWKKPAIKIARPWNTDYQSKYTAYTVSDIIKFTKIIKENL